MIVTNDKKYTPARTAFGNAYLNASMNFFATNQALGASATDLGFMVIPRTAVDMTRTPEAGIETGRRELASCLLYAGMGFFGLGAAHLVGALSDIKKFGKEIHKVTAGSQAVESLGSVWNDSLQKHGRDLSVKGTKENVIKSYVETIFDSVTGLNGEKQVSLSNNPELKKEIIEDFNKLLLNGKTHKIEDKEQKTKLIRKIIKATGSGEHLTLNVKGQEALKLSAKDLLDNTYSLGHTFMQDKVADTFKQTDNIKNNEFIKSFKKFNFRKMAVGLGAVSAVAVVMQAANRYLTKKKTGSDGFCVYKDSTGEKPKKDDSLLFKVERGLAAIGMGLFAATTIVSGDKAKDAGKGLIKDTLNKFKKIPKKLEFNKLMPNINQYKYIYGVTIIGRMLAASDQNELRETTTRDILGFTSWLILGDVVAKAIGKHFEKTQGVKLLNYPNKDEKESFNKLMHSHLKTHEEILYSAENIKIKDNVVNASKQVQDPAKKALKYLNRAQIAGYAASGLVLGIGIPVLNKIITNKLHEKKITKMQNAPQKTEQDFDQSKFLKEKSKEKKTFDGFTQKA